ncbi:hypothetical protein L3Q82_000418 [Scortum barcoo]|uniref:Uncharacterized protein n=1 Tax=Scortum barcoo TaxID=214431 RepID=A0ACB8X9S3_9TELE|nr:hypothetical protein L3Q82_000418 [Scortum barcoo]
MLCYQLQRLPLRAFIDSGAEESFLDAQVAAQAGILSEALEKRACSGQQSPGSGGAPYKPKASSDTIDLSGVPHTYHDLKEVFSKDKAVSFPPHRPYDCTIELVTDAIFPSSWLYNLSRPENEVMEKYIKEFFFVEKKDSSLQPCIPFHGLNNITVKNKYPLPLTDSAFTPLQGAIIFT